MQSDSSNLTVCGIKAALSTSSTGNSAKFVLPKLATTYSVSNYNIT